MIHAVVFTPAANQDFLDSLDWYKTQKEGLDDRFEFAVIETIEAIGNNPLRYPIRHKNIRAIILKSFPFIIFYKFEAREKQVVVLAILHQSRNPKIWEKR